MRLRHTVTPLLAALSLAALAPVEAVAAPVAPELPEALSFRAAADLPGPRALAPQPGPDEGQAQDGGGLLRQAVAPVQSLLGQVPLVGPLLGGVAGQQEGYPSEGGPGQGPGQQGPGAGR